MSVRPPSGLGRGLSALLGEAPAPSPAAADAAAGSSVRQIDVAAIRPNRHQPRRQFDDAALEELAESIRQRGVLQPVLVRRASDGGFELVAGERRWRAAQRARLHQIPALVREFDEAATAEVALIENIQRQDLNALEEAQGYQQLIDLYGHSQEQVAQLVHKSRSHVSNMLRLLELPEFVRQALLGGELSMGHARALAAAPDAERLAREVIARGLSVRDTEKLVRGGKPPSQRIERKSAAGRPGADPDILALERQLADLLGIKVRIQDVAGNGTLSLHYSSLDQLDMICQRLSGERI